MISNSIKKEIIKKWSDEFPDLSVYAQNRLYKSNGPFIIGIEILSLPRSEDYRPIFVCYPLWKSDIRKCFEEPIFLQEIHNRKGFQFNIPYAKHIASFQEAVDCAKEQSSILKGQDISIQQLFEVLDKQFSQILIKSSPVGQAKLFEGKLMGALYKNDMNAIEIVWNEIQKASKSWDPNLFEWKYGKIDVWFQGLRTTITNRETFLKQIEANKEDKKIAMLKSSELTK